MPLPLAARLAAQPRGEAGAGSRVARSHQGEEADREAGSDCHRHHPAPLPAYSCSWGHRVKRKKKKKGATKQKRRELRAANQKIREERKKGRKA